MVFNLVTPAKNPWHVSSQSLSFWRCTSPGAIILSTTERYCSESHFTNKKTEAQKDLPKVTWLMWNTWPLNTWSLNLSVLDSLAYPFGSACMCPFCNGTLPPSSYYVLEPPNPQWVLGSAHDE